MPEHGNNLPHIIATLRARINSLITGRLSQASYPDLAPSHGAILNVLYEKGGISLQEISDKIQRDKSTVTVLVRRLEKLGYVARSRDAKDGRSFNIQLTIKGIMFREVFERIFRELMDMMWQGTVQDEREYLCEQLMRISRRL